MTQETQSGYGIGLASEPYTGENFLTPKVLEDTGGDGDTLLDHKINQGHTLEELSLEDDLLGLPDIKKSEITREDIVSILKRHSLQEINSYLSRNSRRQVARKDIIGDKIELRPEIKDEQGRIIQTKIETERQVPNYGHWLSDEQIDTLVEIAFEKIQRDYDGGKINYPYARCQRADDCEYRIKERKTCGNARYNGACNEPVL